MIKIKSLIKENINKSGIKNEAKEIFRGLHAYYPSLKLLSSGVWTTSEHEAFLKVNGMKDEDLEDEDIFNPHEYKFKKQGNSYFIIFKSKWIY
jgi:hypothetical protein